MAAGVFQHFFAKQRLLLAFVRFHGPIFETEKPFENVCTTRGLPCMHGLFDHGPVFSAAVQIIFQTGWAIACGMEARYLPNERKTAWTRRTARL